MGMFDTLYIDTDKLPLSDKEKKLLGKNPDFQTKDWDCVMTEIFITENGDLEVNEWEYEVVPEKDRPHPNDKGILGIIGSLKRVGERRVKQDYTGCINFYTGGKLGWIEFNANFIEGNLKSIEKIND